MKIKITSSVLTACLLALASARGAVVYDNGTPNQQSGNEMTQWLQAENFQLSNPASITSAQFWTGEGAEATWNGTIQWWVFDDAGETPGGIVSSGFGADVTKLATGLTFIGLTEFVYSFTLNTSELAAGTTYWFGLHLGDDYERHEIYWETTNWDLANAVESFGGTMDNWFSNDQEHAFNLSASAGTPGTPGTPGVPDASSTGLLLGVALTGLVGISRRRKA